MKPEVGDVVAGKYRLDSVLGAGAMGMVFAATHLELERIVAVKFVNSELVQQPEIAARFLREARAAVKIQNEHVAHVIDVGHPEAGPPYIVMEYLRGQDLSDLIRSTEISVPDAVDYVIQACSAMDEAHQLGIVHRDLKPANLFLTYRRDGSPCIKVLDFGISKCEESQVAQPSLTNTAALLGSPAYMSPEQLQSARAVDHRSDIWALGVILYELLARRSAFNGDTLPSVLTAILRDEPVRVDRVNPQVHPELAAVIRRCLMKDREQRFQSVAELASALRPFAPERSLWDIERILRLRQASLRPGMPVSSMPPRPSSASAGSVPPSQHTGAPSSSAPPPQSIGAVGSSLRPQPSGAPVPGVSPGHASTVRTGGGKDRTAGSWVEDQAVPRRSSRSSALLALSLFGGVGVLGGLFAVGYWLLTSLMVATGAPGTLTPAVSALHAADSPDAKKVSGLAPSVSSAALHPEPQPDAQLETAPSVASSEALAPANSAQGQHQTDVRANMGVPARAPQATIATGAASAGPVSGPLTTGRSPGRPTNPENPLDMELK